jgi:hypothetical protein
VTRTLKELITADVVFVFLNEDQFASVDSYTPLGGTARDVIGVAEELVDAELDQETGDETHTERIRYWTSRLQADDGIDDPQIGDQLVLSSDPDSAPYTFSGEIPERDADSWWVMFERPRRTGRGAKRST